MTDFEDRMRALEARETVLPWSQLMRKLEQSWQPDAESLLAPGSITIDALSSALTFGVNTVVWAGVLTTTNVLTVLHGLGRQPTNIQITSANNNTHVAYSNITLTSFDVTGRTVDGSVPAAAVAVNFSWEAK